MGIDMRMSRRGFVKGASSLAAASLLAACAQDGGSPAANDNNENGSGAATTVPEVDCALGDTMSDYLVNFVTSGDVNGSGVPAWTAYDAGNEALTYMELGNEVVERTMDADKAAFWTAYLGLK